MNDTMKNMILVAAVILTIGSCLMAISSSQAAGKIQQGLEQERYNRMVVEEKLEKASSKISSLVAELDSTKNKIRGIQAIMQQDNLATADLKSQLDSISKLKESLEKKIEEMQKAQGSVGPVQAAASQVPAVTH